MKRHLSFWLFMVAAPLFATTIVTNQPIQSPTGSRLNGKIIFALPAPAVNTQTGTVITPVGTPIRVVNGLLASTLTLPGNDILSPKMYYDAYVYDSTGRWLSTYHYNITGTTFDIGSAPLTPVTTSNVSQQDWTVNNLQVIGELFPTVTGGQLGDSSHRWDIFVRNLDVSSAIKSCSGNPWFDVTCAAFAGGAKCDSVTDDTSAIQAAFNAAKAVGAGAFVYFPPTSTNCIVTGQLDFRSANGIRIGGLGGGNNTLAFPQITMTGTTSPLINAVDAQDLYFQNITIVYNNAAFTGNLLDISTSSGAGSSRFDNVNFDGTSTAHGATNLVLATNSIKLTFDHCTFGWAINGINAANGNALTVQDSQFGNTGNILSGAYLLNISQGSSIIGNSFELINVPNTSTPFDSSSQGCFGCLFAGNWIGDPPVGYTGTMVKATGGMAFIGNTFQGQASANLMSINGGQDGLMFTGNSTLVAFSTVFSSNAPVTGVNITGNKWSGTLTTFYSGSLPSTGIMTDNTGLTRVFGNLKANQLQSGVATGTAPLTVVSTTLVPNLNTQIINGVTVSGTPTAGQGLVATSTSAASWQSVGGSFSCVNVTPVTVSANTSGDQTLMACTMPAGTMNVVGKTVSIQGAGVYSTPAASTTTVNLKVKLCTVSGCGSGTVITLASMTSAALGAIQATNDPWNLQLYLTTQAAGATASLEAHGNLTIDISALTTAAEAVYADGNTATVGTIDSTAQLFLQVTGSFSAASASNSNTHRQLTAESIN